MFTTICVSIMCSHNPLRHKVVNMLNSFVMVFVCKTLHWKFRGVFYTGFLLLFYNKAAVEIGMYLLPFTLIEDELFLGYLLSEMIFTETLVCYTLGPNVYYFIRQIVF